MKIFVVGKYYAEGFALHIANTLDAMGHTTIRHEVGTRATGRGRASAVARLAHDMWQRVGAHSPAIAARRDEEIARAAAGADLVLSCHDFLAPSTVRTLKDRLGIRVAMWCPDHIAAFGRSMFLNAPYDAVFIKDPHVVRTLHRETSVAAYYLPEAFNPDEHRPVELTPAELAKYECDITTAGNMYPSRAAFFSQLTDYDVKIWGNPAPGWMDVSAIRRQMHSEFVGGAEKAKAFLAARAVVNNLNLAEVDGLNARAFEICGIGAFQIVSWRAGGLELFAEDREVVTYRDIADLRRKLARYLPDADARREIARAGRVRALRDHTYAHRLGLLLSTVAGTATGYPLPEVGAVPCA